MGWWCGVFIAVMSISRLLGSAGDNVVPNKNLDSVPGQHGNIRGNTVDASGEQDGKHQPCALGKHDL